MNEKTKLRRPRKLKAFTLLEMLVVMAIIGVLASIIIPSTIERIRTSKIESANARAEEIYMAAQNYLTDMQIKRVPVFNATSADTTVPIFPGTKGSSGVDSDGSRNSGIGFYVNPDGEWTITDRKGFTRDEKLESKCTYKQGISKYLGSTTLESLGDTSFFIYFDPDTYTVEVVLYNEQADDPKTYPVESQTYVSKMANLIHGSTGAYTQVFGAPTEKDGKSQEYDTNQFLSGNKVNTAPYVGQYPVPYK